MMRYKFFSNSMRTWEAMFEAIKNAQESVYLEMYIFNDDILLFDFLNLLKEKAKSGLRVRMVLDSFGSSELGKSAINTLRENGVELLFLSYFLHRTHRKILIVDEARAFLGGVNLSQRFKLWDDLGVEIKERRLVKHIIRSFAKVYRECGGKDRAILAQDRAIILDKTRNWLLEHFPVRKKFNLKKVYKEHLGLAKEKIVLVTPYFMPKRWLIGALHQAVLRGVKVEILMPKTTDLFFIDRVSYFYMFKLSKLGVDFYIESQMNHAKLMIIDEKEAIVGSQNLDFLSFELNNEIGVFFKDADSVQKLSSIAKNWKKEATLFDSKIYRPTWFDYILSPVINVFSRIL